MFSFVNRTVFDLPLTWDRTRFEAIRAKYRQARKLIESSVNVQYEKQLKYIHLQNLDIEKTIIETNEHLLKHEKKVHIFDSLTEIASQSLPNYFDKRMEHVRTIIQEHCSAIQKILHEENEYWKEIHSAIDQNLITSNDIHPCIQNISIINEEQNTLEILNDQPQTFINIDHPSSTENPRSTKQERISINLNPIQYNQISSSINKTYVIKLEETPNTETNELLPIETSSHIPSAEINASPMYSQPNLPARLCFSPTLLQDEESESIKNVLSPLDQNQTINLVKPKVILHRVHETFLIDYLKKEETNDVHLRPKRTDSIQRESIIHQQNSFTLTEPISKHRAHSTIQNESESIDITKNIKQTRKRKQSASEDNDTKSSTIVLRKRKPISFVEIEEKIPKRKVANKRKTKKKNGIFYFLQQIIFDHNFYLENEIPIREPSPLPIIDRTIHYSSQFFTRTL
ncbi:unnamed protein product [Rotaria sp. Silwood2]|nr:unnamed protein product [Rotaria sp. Silwood2]CAF2488781.1 unnamed protein product [Rotaria sp. Silwood2]CAF2719493.1 unnamed protein product [Rotaria sp. Silwood2]CAF2871593.1 unnamed protein product [Rotaria sp. Silwood2]CAF3919427.1 unnamed protein product [Rotaria sp. Silwood2]